MTLELVAERDVCEWMRNCGVVRGSDVGLAFRPSVGVGLAVAEKLAAIPVLDPISIVSALETEFQPRWIWWDRTTATQLAEAGLRIGRCWDVLTVDRLLRGQWRTSIPQAWASLNALPLDSLPTLGQLNLLTSASDEGNDQESPVRPDLHLRPEWVGGAWGDTPTRLASWARIAHQAATIQRTELDARPFPDRAQSTARSESAAEYLCVELGLEGLPIDTAEVERIIRESAGDRPIDEAGVEKAKRDRDELVFQHIATGSRVDLRNPNAVKAMLRRANVDVPDTRASRLEQFRDNPLVDALLTWRKTERIATTYGYRWIDENIRDGRLRGDWTSSDGAAGRMTASSGLHNLPAELRPAVAAEPGFVFARADLGQIEPRVLAVVSGDERLIAATLEPDLYEPIARTLNVTRAVAKVAVLGAMYGSTTGESAHALRGLERAYPTAMAFLEAAAARGRAGDSVMTRGGRLVRMWTDESEGDSPDRDRSVGAARGRFARNAVIQGAAAEFFKVWAVTVRSRCVPIDAQIVMCLHDELLVHVPADAADDAAHMLTDALGEASHRWSPDSNVVFAADVSIIERWSQAKS